jgi:hypothetical protein
VLQVRTKLSRDCADKLISRILRVHADVAVGVLVSLYPWAGLADVVGFSMQPLDASRAESVVSIRHSVTNSSVLQGHTGLYCCSGLMLYQRPFKGYRDALQELSSRLEVDIKTASNRSHASAHHFRSASRPP